eukprot:TRINITY_DN6493_c0_g1_i5.p1 TRINITY_DN6493_c0_g1~~TRINITY_DN6493_c0_g1_i5.p1  ORF type:complete len:759 (+),score=111.40 TRINITY_DN6493_c0_g1_i5:315-2279(+)
MEQVMRETQEQIEKWEGEWGAGVKLGWGQVSEYVLGEEVDLWGVHMEGAFLDRMEEIVKSVFEEIGENVQEPLKACLEIASKAEACAPGEIIRGSEKEANQELWRKGVEQIVESVDNKIRDILQGIVLMLGGPNELSSFLDISYGYATRTVSGTLPHSLSRGRQIGRKRVQVLETAVHEVCQKVFVDLAKELGAKLKELPSVSCVAKDAPIIEQVLVICLLANLLQSKTYYIPLAMGPATYWTQLEKSSSAQRSNRYQKLGMSGSEISKADETGLQNIKLSLRDIDLQSLGIWAGWVGRGLCQEVKDSIKNEELLQTNVTPPNWEEVVVSAEDDMRFKLPAIPSASFQAFLMKCCTELGRGGGSFLIGSEGMKLYAWILMECVIESVQDVLSPSQELEKKLTEKGILQLLLDLRFVKNALQGGTPPGKLPESEQQMGMTRSCLQNKEPEVAAALANRKVQLTKLQEQLSDKLDPIDWATYEPHLWKLEERYCSKVSVLYGALMHLNPLSRNKDGAAAPVTRMMHTGTHTGMNVSPVCPRFHYLPISTPAVKDKDQAVRRSNLSIFDLSPEACSIRESDLVAQYSLTNFSDKKSFQGSRSAQTGQQSAALLPNAASFTQLGSMFSDRASEMTALAQERFQNLQTNIFSSFRLRQQ